MHVGLSNFILHLQLHIPGFTCEIIRMDFGPECESVVYAI